MPSKKPIGLGIIGCGRAGHGMHCGELEKAGLLGKQFDLVAACDTHAPWRKRMAERFPDCTVYADIRELLADDRVELVSIATRSCDHVAHGIMALKAGKHVFMEKPIAVSFAEGKKLLRANEKYDGNLYVRHNRRFDPDFLHVREIVDSGVLGDLFEIRLFRASWQRRDDWQTIIEYGGGQLLNWGPHVIDHALQLLGAPKKPLQSIEGDLKLIAAVGDAEDHVRVTLTGHNGVKADVEISGGSAIGAPVWVVLGTRGGLSCDGKTITLKYIDPKKKLKSRKADRGVPGAGFGSPEKIPWVEKQLDVKPKKTWNIWEEVYRSVRNGKTFPIGLDEALEVMRVVSEVKKGTPFTPSAKRSAKPRAKAKRK